MLKLDELKFYLWKIIKIFTLPLYFPVNCIDSDVLLEET